ncbi:MAG: glycosyltransferase [Clostridia bacterium]|nr:glycosyltransferase [Clostridia bacterium]
MKPNFSICAIARNEEKTLPKLIESLKEFQSMGGEVILVDTGSSDKTAEVARNAGFIVEEVGNKFLMTISKKQAEHINNFFVVGNEAEVIKQDDKVFDFASARNYSASLASNKHVSFVDCDEAFTVFDINNICKLIDEGFDQFEYNFIFAHKEDGSPAIQFIQSKFYNKEQLQWVGITHEVLQPLKQGLIKRVQLSKKLFLLEHFQNRETNRDGYLRGLALDCFNNKDNDRNSHYLAREMLYKGRLNSAIKEFDRHIKMNRWDAERAQSMIFSGDCFGFLGNPDKQIEMYSKAFSIDSKRNESLIKLARFFLHNKNYQAAIAYATAALTLKHTGYYADMPENYENVPYEILYQSCGWLGKIEEAKKYIAKALEYKPYNSIYLRDLRYYMNLPTVDIILPTMNTRPEGLKRCIESIYKLNYPQELINIIQEKGPENLPTKMKMGVEKGTGEYIAFLADDTSFESDSLILNVWDSITTGKRLVAFDTGVRNDEGYINEHFLIKRDLLPSLEDGLIFHTDFKHYCVDDWLWKQCEKLNEAMVGKGKMNHYHWSRIGSGIKPDELALKIQEGIPHDREVLKRKLKKLNDK